ncbi:hypothetical protein PT285_09965 [Lactobacillus sp. ESL0791]|uniref:hypothetical protein n=1 Tax=Lactobacillus sp. ESL0791 TaxID=2983234 RepID=UPI0023F6AEB3|nr:hypothetical protein [Lactobacillus sp. ESL0791]MDF7639726.1 hypothetical protein [Lactobacillus sp. ESL0791]
MITLTFYLNSKKTGYEEVSGKKFDLQPWDYYGAGVHNMMYEIDNLDGNEVLTSCRNDMTGVDYHAYHTPELEKKHYQKFKGSYHN